MKSKPKTRKSKLSDAELKAHMVQLFESGITVKTEILGELRRKWSVGSDRYALAYETHYHTWAKLKDNAQSGQVGVNAVEALKSALKSKTERMAMLDKMLEPDYRHEEIIGGDVKTGKVLRVKRPLTPREIQGLHAELSKMGGDYAPAGVKVSGDQDKPIKHDHKIVVEIIECAVPLAASEERIHD